jgi:hypothetical protein
VDRVLLAGMGLGAALIFQPFWSVSLKWGFGLTLVCTLLEIATAHLPTNLSQS